MWTPLSDKVGWVLALVLGLVALAIVGLLGWALIEAVPTLLEGWKVTDAHQRDTVLALLLILNLFSQTRCKGDKCKGDKCRCEGGCSK